MTDFVGLSLPLNGCTQSTQGVFLPMRATSTHELSVSVRMDRSRSSRSLRVSEQGSATLR